MAVGARSVEDQQHRFVQVGQIFATGFKNPTSGNLNVMFNGIYAAQNKQSFPFSLGKEVETTGNPFRMLFFVVPSMNMVKTFLTTTMII